MLTKSDTLVKTWMEDFYQRNFLKIGPQFLFELQAPAPVGFGLLSASVSNDNIKHSIARVWKEKSYLLCPHTAVGVHVALSPNITNNFSRAVVVATAHAAKFQSAIEKSLGKEEGAKALASEAAASHNVSRASNLTSLPTTEIFLPRVDKWCDMWEQQVRKQILKYNSKSI
jgi:threonine synthase